MKLSFRTLLLELLAALVLLAIVATGALAWRLSRGPLDLTLFKPRVEAALAESRGGRPVSVEKLALEWSADKRSIEATVQGITAYDLEGNIQARARQGAIEFDTGSMMRGQVRAVRMRVENGHVTLTRSADGKWAVTPEGVDPASIPDRNPDEAVVPLDLKEWRKVLPPLRNMVAQRSMELITFSNFQIDVVDEVTGLVWRASDSNGRWAANDQGLVLDVSADLEGESAPEAAQISFYSDADIKHFSFELGVVGADPERLASFVAAEDLPLRYEGVADFNIGGAASEADGFHSAQFSMASENGAILYRDVRHPVQSIGFELLMDMETRRLDLTQLNIQSDKVGGNYQGWVDLSQLFQGGESPDLPVTLSARDVWVDLTPVFEKRWDFQMLDLTGTVSPKEYSIELDRVISRIGKMNGTGSGRIFLKELADEPVDESVPEVDTVAAGPADAVDTAEGQGGSPDEIDTVDAGPFSQIGSRLGIVAQAVGEGELTPEEMLVFWPVNLGAEARGWVRDHVLAGVATHVDFKMDFPPGANAAGFLPDEHLRLDFDVRDGVVSFLSDVPPVTNASGKGVLQGNSLVIDLESGELGGWDLDKGRVNLPQFHPRGETSVITASGRGDLQHVMQMLDQSSLNLGEEYGLDVNRMRGLGGLDVTIRQPMVTEINEEDIKVEVRGGFVDVTAPDLAAGFGLERTDVNVDLTPDKLLISGAGRFGPSPVEFEWSENFHAEGEGTHLTATAVVGPDLLNAFGVMARTFMQGEAEMELDARGNGREFDQVSAKLDFTRAALDLSEIGWVKQYGVPATGVMRYGSDASGLAVATGDIKAEGLELSGEAVFRKEAGLQRATIERIYAKDRLDLRGTLLRQEDGALKVDVSGPFLDISPWMDGLLTMGGDEPPGVFMDAHIAVDTLLMREETSLSNAKLVMEIEPDALKRGLIAGTIQPGLGIEGTMESDGAVKIVNLRSDDAGFVIKALTNSDYLIGGAMDFKGRFDKSDGNGHLSMSNVRLKNAPLLAQVFSLASLRGLTDVLSGDGVLFTDVEAPVTLTRGRLDMPGVRASGPALGLTARGWLELGSGEIGLDGVVVPSFGVNSALGGIPIIGDLFVSRQGEGVFAVTYSVKGTLERARVAINPLSAVTPGFLRRIMENPSAPPPEEGKEEADLPTEDATPAAPE